MSPNISPGNQRPRSRPMPCQSSAGVLNGRRFGRNQADHGQSSCNRSRGLISGGEPRPEPCSIRSVTEPTTEPTTDRANRPIGTQSIESIQDDFRGRNYIADRSLATAVFLALELGRPLLLEGEAGVGKTELGEGPRGEPRRPPHPPPVLRGPRRQHRRVRVELPAPDARVSACSRREARRSTRARTTSSVATS